MWATPPQRSICVGSAAVVHGIRRVGLIGGHHSLLRPLLGGRLHVEQMTVHRALFGYLLTDKIRRAVRTGLKTEGHGSGRGIFLPVRDTVAVGVRVHRIHTGQVLVGVDQAVAVGISTGSVGAHGGKGIQAVLHFPAVRQAVPVTVRITRVGEVRVHLCAVRQTVAIGVRV